MKNVEKILCDIYQLQRTNKKLVCALFMIIQKLDLDYKDFKKISNAISVEYSGIDMVQVIEEAFTDSNTNANTEIKKKLQEIAKQIDSTINHLC